MPTKVTAIKHGDLYYTENQTQLSSKDIYNTESEACLAIVKESKEEIKRLKGVIEHYAKRIKP